MIHESVNTSYPGGRKSLTVSFASRAAAFGELLVTYGNFPARGFKTRRKIKMTKEKKRSQFKACNCYASQEKTNTRLIILYPTEFLECETLSKGGIDSPATCSNANQSQFNLKLSVAKTHPSKFQTFKRDVSVNNNEKRAR